MRGTGAEQPVVAKKSVKADRAKGLRHPARNGSQPQGREELSDQAKPFLGVGAAAGWQEPYELRGSRTVL